MALLLCCLSIAFTAACPEQQLNEREIGVERPLVLVLSPQYRPRDPLALELALRRRSGLQLDLRLTESAEQAIDLVERREADAALLSLFDYLLCADLYRVVPLVQLRRHGAGTTQEAEVFVRADSGVERLSELGGRQVAFVDRYSITGFLLPASLLHEANVAVQVSWLGSHEAVLEAVRSGQAVAGATYTGAVERDSTFRVLARTPVIANEPVFVRTRVPERARAALRRALLELSASQDERALLEGMAGASGFGEVDPRVYDEAVATVRAAGRQVEDLVEGGWVRANEHRRPLWTYAP